MIEGLNHMKDLLEQMVTKFNNRIEEDPKLKKELEGMTKRVVMDLGTVKYNFILEDCKVEGINDGALDDPDILIESTPDIIEGIITKRIRPMKAFALRKVKIHGDIEDLMRFRKMF